MAKVYVKQHNIEIAQNYWKRIITERQKMLAVTENFYKVPQTSMGPYTNRNWLVKAKKLKKNNYECEIYHGLPDMKQKFV